MKNIIQSKYQRDKHIMYGQLPITKTALVVDDNKDTRFMMKFALECRGFKVVVANNSKNAINIARRKCPDIIFMDISLPDLDGLDTTRYIRELPAINTVPIVIVSGYSTADFLTEAQRAGCNEYLCKPIDFDLMDTALDRLLSQKVSSL